VSVFPNYVQIFTQSQPLIDTDPSGTQTNVLGPMHRGGDGNAQDEQGFALDPEGLFVNVSRHEIGVCSRTLYVVNPNYADKFRVAGTLIAEVEFDRVNCTLEGNSFTAPTIWAVGLNFKSGNETDRPDDLIVGPTCQFRNKGQLNFHGTDFDNEPAHVETYASYSANATIFKLRTTLIRAADTVQAYSSLSLSTLKYPFAGNSDGAQDLTQAEANPQTITAIGIAVVNKGIVESSPIPDPLPLHTPPPTSDALPSVVSVRLRSFSLYYGASFRSSS
jgi:hypothetical protein